MRPLSSAAGAKRSGAQCVSMCAVCLNVRVECFLGCFQDPRFVCGLMLVADASFCVTRNPTCCRFCCSHSRRRAAHLLARVRCRRMCVQPSRVCVTDEKTEQMLKIIVCPLTKSPLTFDRTRCAISRAFLANSSAPPPLAPTSCGPCNRPRHVMAKIIIATSTIKPQTRAHFQGCGSCISGGEWHPEYACLRRAEAGRTPVVSDEAVCEVWPRGRASHPLSLQAVAWARAARPAHLR